MIILGIILLIAGFVLKISILWTIGIVLLVIGVVLMLMGRMGRAVGGRRQLPLVGRTQLSGDRESAGPPYYVRVDPTRWRTIRRCRNRVPNSDSSIQPM